MKQSALVNFGIATAVRDVAICVGIVLGLLYLVSVFGLNIDSPGWRRHAQHSIALSTSPWTGLGLLAACAAAALLVGGLLLRLRDA